MKDYEASQQNLTALLETPSIAEEKVVIGIGQQASPQEVSLKAAVLNIEGAIYSEQNQSEKAIACFEKSLIEFSDFELAKNNLAILQQKL